MLTRVKFNEGYINEALTLIINEGSLIMRLILRGHINILTNQ